MSGRIVSIPADEPVWEHVYTVAPLVIVGTREPDGSHDLAPKHMAMPVGWQDLFCFVCSPRHATYVNIVERGAFTVSFPRPEQVVEAGLAASPRVDDGSKPTLAALPTTPASTVDGVLVEGSYLYLECERERIIDGFGDWSMIVGRIVAVSALEDALLRFERDPADQVRAVPLLAFLSPDRFAQVDDSRSFPFPLDFRR